MKKTIFLRSSTEKDLDVLIFEDLKWKKQVYLAVSEANKVLGMLKKTFMSREVKLWRDLYVSLIRPHLEYAIQIWTYIAFKAI